MKKRFVITSLMSVLILAFWINWYISYQVGQEEALVPVTVDQDTPLLQHEKDVFLRAEYALDYANMPVDEARERSLNEYYDHRAFHGAPPSIPHVVDDERSMGGESCLKCHENGGFVSEFDAYAPVAPHPDMLNCRQCHVEQNQVSNFKGNQFRGAEAPGVGDVNQSLVSSPPMIPHEIHMRENCLSCHAGPSAPKEIRVSHPERINCRQCHVVSANLEDIGHFTRKYE